MTGTQTQRNFADGQAGTISGDDDTVRQGSQVQYEEIGAKIVSMREMLNAALLIDGGGL